jgi:hypothetical protein
MTLAESLPVTLVIGSLEGGLGGMEEIVCQEVSPKVVEVGNSLGGREVGERRRLGADTGEHLLGVS